MSKFLAIWVLPFYSSETKFKHTEIFWGLSILLGFLFFFFSPCINIFLQSVSSSCLLKPLIHVVASVFNHKHFLQEHSWARPSPSPHSWFRGGWGSGFLRVCTSSQDTVSSIPRLPWPLSGSENSLWLFSNNAILSVRPLLLPYEEFAYVEYPCTGFVSQCQ